MKHSDESVWTLSLWFIRSISILMKMKNKNICFHLQNSMCCLLLLFKVYLRRKWSWVGWCFGLHQFVSIVSESCPLDLDSSSSIMDAYLPYMWGNYAYNNKKRQFVALSQSSTVPNIFVQYIFKPIYMLYKQCYNENRNIEKISTMINILHLNVCLSSTEDDPIGNKEGFASIRVSSAIEGILFLLSIINIDDYESMAAPVSRSFVYPLFCPNHALAVLCQNYPSPKESQAYKYINIFPTNILEHSMTSLQSSSV